MTKDALEQISESTLFRFFSTRGEGDEWDFKRTLDIEPKDTASSAFRLTKHARLELVRDVLALANTPGGGHLILGVSNDYEQTGLPGEFPHVATEFIADQIDTYNCDIRLVAAEHVVTRSIWECPKTRRFGLVYVYESPRTAVPRIDGQCEDDKKKPIIVFKENEILVRRNAKTRTANERDLERLRLKASEPEAHDTSPLPSNLPGSDQIAPDFVGRARELERLQTWFRDPRARVWLLSGDGGKGKSALAYQFACEVQVEAPSDYYAVVWLSAKRRAFIDGITTPTLGPDFVDLRTLVDAINQFYGYTLDEACSLEDRQDHAFELLRVLPVLLVVDDIDSVDPEHQDTFPWLMSLLATPTKVLFTSRRSLFGLQGNTTQVEGFGNDDDGHTFIRSRLKRLRLDEKLFNPKTFEKIIDATNGSPLFIEDLLRLSKTCSSVNSAVKLWGQNGGDEAREYALKREMESLSPSSIEILIACCLNEDPISSLELQNLTGLSEERESTSLSELQNLFLVGLPQLVDNVPRFAVLANTRTLVRKAYSGTDCFRHLAAALDRIRALPTVDAGKQDIGAYIRQASALQARGQHEDAERAILGALEHHLEHPDLIAYLGITYLHWRPASRTTDAEAQFTRAAQLGCRRDVMYDQWAGMEISHREFSKAAEIASLGRENAGDIMRLLYREGYARSRSGQELRRSFQPDQAQKQLEKADILLRKALKDPEVLSGPWERQMNSRVYLALVLNCEALGRYSEMFRVLRRWHQEYPDNPPPETQVERLRYKYPEFVHELDSA